MSERVIESLRVMLGEGEYIPVQGRGNSRVALWQGKKTYFIKRYPDDQNWKRRQSEKNAIEFYRQQGITNIPQLIGSDDEHNYSVFSYIKGTDHYVVDETILRQFADFLQQVTSIPNAASFPDLAKEAFFHSSELREHIRRRLEFLQNIPDEMLQNHLGEYIVKYFKEVGFDDFTDFSCDDKLIVSPSDFGTHNSLLTADGQIYFIDFEYAGKDSLFKLLGDIYWHMGSHFSREQRMKLINPYITTEKETEIFGKICLLMGLKWSLLLLNEFIPSNLNRRIAAAGDIDAEQIKIAQLKKSRDILGRVANEWYR